MSEDIQKLNAIIKQQQQELADLRQKLKSKLENKDEQILQLEKIIALLPGHVYWQNLDNVLLGSNDQQAKDLGLSSKQEIIGKSIQDYQPQ